MSGIFSKMSGFADIESKFSAYICIVKLLEISEKNGHIGCFMVNI